MDGNERGIQMKNENKKLNKTLQKNYLESKESFFHGLGDTFFMILAVLISFAGTYLFLPWHGIISAVPFVVVCGIICTFIKTSEILKTMLFFVSPFVVALIMNESVLDSFVFGILCSSFYLLSYSARSLFKKGGVKCRTVSAFILLFALGLHVFSNSTPWDVKENNNKLIDYIQYNYEREPLNVSEIKFDSIDRSYSLYLIPNHDARNAFQVVLKDGEIIKDEYVAYTEKYNMLVGAGKITYVIREKYPDLKFSVESNRIFGYPFSVPASIEPKADYSKYMDYSVYFSSYNGVKEFADLAEQCYRALLTSGFGCRTITFYGGIGTRYIAKISVPFNSMTKDLGGFVEACDSNKFFYTSLK